MSGETDLGRLLATLSARMEDGLYVFATVAELPSGVHPRMIFHEAEGITLILLRDQADRLGLPWEFPCRMITLEVHSSLSAVGFMARIATELARRGIAVNPVSGFHHDHLFVPEPRATEAMQILAEIAGS